MTNNKPVIKKEDLIYPELSYKIVGVLFEVFNELGYGYKEIHYQRAISKLFKDLGVTFQEQVQTSIQCKDQNVGSYYFDFLIENIIVLEIKKGDYFSRHNIEQVLNYLKSRNFKLGILANFTSDGVKFKRIVNLE